MGYRHQVSPVVLMGAGHRLTGLGPEELDFTVEPGHVGLELHHAPHPLEVETGLGELVDVTQPGQIPFAEPTAATGRPARVEETLALVDRAGSAGGPRPARPRPR